MLSLIVNLADGRTESFQFDDWRSWASHVESQDARGFALQNGSSSTRFVPPRKFRSVSARVEGVLKGDELRGVKVRYFADPVVFVITLYISGVVVSGIEKLGRRIGQ